MFHNLQMITRQLYPHLGMALVSRRKPCAVSGRCWRTTLVKSPKVYIRDSGLVHALLGIHNFDTLLGHRVVGNSWER
jgi:hypothetical protein